MRKLILIGCLVLAGCAVQPSKPIVTPPAPTVADPAPSVDNPVTRVCSVSYLRDGTVARPNQPGNAVVTDSGYLFQIRFLDTGKVFNSPVLTSPDNKGGRYAMDAEGIQWMRSRQGQFMVYGFQMQIKGHMLTIGAVC